MEYCNGGELHKVLEKYIEKNGKPFPEEIVQHLMRQIIDAFKYIHSKDIMHRDIKLENILLNYDTDEDKQNQNLMKANIKIIDFGFAAKLEKTGLKYTTLGSPINMDPLILKELQKRGKKTQKLGYDKKADIWSIGTICYEMAIGKYAFDAEKIDELIKKIEKGEYTVPTNLSKEIISFINGMLQYGPERRLNIEQLANHNFLKKNVNNFEKLDLHKVNKNLVKSKLKLNVKANATIWALFNDEDEDKLMKIKGNDFATDMPIAEVDYKKANSNPNIINNQIKDNNNNNLVPRTNSNNIPLVNNNNLNNNNNINNNNLNNNLPKNYLNNNLPNNNINNNNQINKANVNNNIMRNNNPNLNNNNNQYNNNINKNNNNQINKANTNNNIVRNNNPNLNNKNQNQNNINKNNNILNNNLQYFAQQQQLRNNLAYRGSLPNKIPNLLNINYYPQYTNTLTPYQIQPTPIQGYIGAPVMNLPQAQYSQGYAMLGNYAYTTGYYK
jgi:serine/threonine-protein kinase ULK/ATG1